MTRIVIFALLFQALLLQALVCHSEEILFSSKYSGEMGSYRIESTRTLLLKDDGSYRFQSIADHSLGSVTETTDFKLLDGDIYPVRYHYLRSIFGFKKEEFIDYNWDKKQATYRRKGKSKNTFVHKLVPNMLDPSVYQLQLQRDAWLSAGVFKNNKIDYNIIKNKNIKNMPFELIGKEALKIGEKEYLALKLQLNYSDDTKMTTTWLVPELNYHIGKIVHRDEDGDTYEITLKSYQANSAIFNAIYPTIPQAQELLHTH